MFTRVNPAGWSDGQTLTAAKMNSLDTNLSGAVDCATLTIATSGSPAAVTRAVQDQPLPIAGTNGQILATLWSVSGGYWSSTGVSANSNLVFPINLPNGSTLASFGVRLKGDGSHTALPAAMPTASIYKYPVSGSTSATVVKTVTDSSATTGTYCATSGHVIGAGAIGELIDSQNWIYRLYITNESGANATSGLCVAPPYVTRTQTKLDY
jgi:hypothetical protein